MHQAFFVISSVPRIIHIDTVHEQPVSKKEHHLPYVSSVNVARLAKCTLKVPALATDFVPEKVANEF